MSSIEFLRPSYLGGNPHPLNEKSDAELSVAAAQAYHDCDWDRYHAIEKTLSDRRAKAASNA